jgi:methyltransferase (TIGR00027 family)
VSDPTDAAVARTAIGVALIRANESERPDRLFDDPFARALVEGATDMTGGQPYVSRADAGYPTVLRMVAQVIVRTKFFDGYLLDATGDGIRQLVLLAAGLDARGYRLDFPDGVRLFELDQPQVLGYKQRVLAEVTPRCERVAVPVDLRGDWPSALRQRGFDPAVATAWLVEGLLIYLTPTQAARLLEAVTELSAPASRLSFEQSTLTSTPGTLATVRQARDAADVSRLWQGGLGEDGAAWLRQRGWAISTVDRLELARAYGREIPGTAPGEFIVAQKRGFAYGGADFR